MTLEQFKTTFNVKSLNFYASHKSDRFVASFGQDQLLITTEEFDKSKPAFVYANPKDEHGFILSNKEPKAADFVL